MSSGGGESAQKFFPSNCHIAPLRSLDDFIFGSARFQFPQWRDFEKWGNRVVRNLLYYQTNYFLIYLLINMLLFVLNPSKVFYGLLSQTLAFLVARHFISKPSANFIANRLIALSENQNISTYQKWCIIAAASILGYVFLHICNALMWALFTFLLPISFIFLHASARLRNIKNKVVNTIEGFTNTTPMGILLDALNVAPETLLN